MANKGKEIDIRRKTLWLLSRFEAKTSKQREKTVDKVEKYFYSEVLPDIKKLDPKHRGFKGEKKEFYEGYLYMYWVVFPKHKWRKNDPVFEEASALAKYKGDPDF